MISEPTEPFNSEPLAELGPLIREFEQGPFARHSPALAYFLDELRADHALGDFVSLVVRHGADYRLIEKLSGGSLRLFTPQFADPSALELYAFRLRLTRRFEDLDVFSEIDFSYEEDTALHELCPSVLAYVVPHVVKPGDKIEIKVGSLVGGSSYSASIYRLLAPATESACFERTIERLQQPAIADTAEEQAIYLGSSMNPILFDLTGKRRDLSIQFDAKPTRCEGDLNTAVSLWFAESGTELSVSIRTDGQVKLISDHAGVRNIEVAEVGRPVAWCRCTVNVCAEQRNVTARIFTSEGGVCEAPLAFTGVEVSRYVSICFASQHRKLGASSFNGLLETPAVFLGNRQDAELNSLRGTALAGEIDPSILALWDFSQNIESDMVWDVVGKTGTKLINRPKRAVAGSNWDATEFDRRHAPQQYRAIHFHSDDLEDAEWPTAHEVLIPEGARSGAYCVEVVDAAGRRFSAPFYVSAASSDTKSKIALVLPTSTYLAYANYRSRFGKRAAELFLGCIPEVSVEDLLLARHPELGGSTYDIHGDGSGICYSSWRRPVVNLGPRSKPWNAWIDLCLISWLEATGVPYDVITDDDLHIMGAQSLDPYSVAITGCHPEYCSTEILDAYESFLSKAGRLIYPGGNGFYWRISYPENRTDVLEVRRADSATRSWEEDVGNDWHATRPVRGGLWRRNGRSPNALVGVGFVAMGFAQSAAYLRSPLANRAAFIFRGISESIVGSFGLIGDGAAGLELDAANVAAGTPPHALVVARSFDHSETVLMTSEEMLSNSRAIDATLNPRAAAEMVFFETLSGGAVFSVGSIALPASLPHAGFRNNIASVMNNVLQRFLDSTSFEAPTG